jgi:serine/threonine kinase 32
MQMKKANFDVTHELDEFLMVEKPLTHSKRKVNPDLENMKPEIREMEEQYVTTSMHFHTWPISDTFLTGLPSTISAARNACHIIHTTYPLFQQDMTSKAMSQHHYNHKPTR